MSVLDDHNLAEDDGPWLRIGAAAKIAAVSDKTMRNWVDTSLVKGRVTLGGQRQVNLPSLRAVLERSTRAKQDTLVAQGKRGVEPDGEWADPHTAVVGIAATCAGWRNWAPHPKTSTKRLEQLLAAARRLGDALDDIAAVVETELEDRIEDEQ